MGKSATDESFMDREVRERVDKMLAERMVEIKESTEAQIRAAMAAPAKPSKDKGEWHRQLMETAAEFIASKRPITEFWHVCDIKIGAYSVRAIPSREVSDQFTKRELPMVRLEFQPPVNLLYHTMALLSDKNNPVFIYRADITEHQHVRVEQGDIEKYNLDTSVAKVKPGAYSIADVLYGMNIHLADPKMMFDGKNGMMTGDTFQSWFSMKYQMILEKIKTEAAQVELMGKITAAQLKKGDLARKGILFGAELAPAGVGAGAI
jgi:hypothetical protein